MTDQNDIYLFPNDIDANIIARILVLVILVILLMLIFMLPFQWKWRFTFAVVIVWAMMTVFLIVCFRTGAELPTYRRIYSSDRTYELVIMETTTLKFKDFGVYSHKSAFTYKSFGHFYGDFNDTVDNNISVKWDKNEVILMINTKYRSSEKMIRINYGDLQKKYLPLSDDAILH